MRSVLLVDTNILLDLLAKRTPFYKSAALLFTMADQKKVKLSVSALTIAYTNYVLNRRLSQIKTKEVLRKIKVLFNTTALDDKVIDLALNDSTFKDFEDALQYYTAMKSKADVIISRDLKAFKKSSIPVMTAEAFINSL